MKGGDSSGLAGDLARNLIPEGSGSGVERSICEQILADVMETSPPPRTSRELLLALDRNCRHGGVVAIALLATVRRWASETPDLPLEDLVE
ncbi:MAG: hypothetical protein GY711_21105 [bacterium]|nr:hypothetical protein [bacterium]